jgi:hypothetical protein
MNFISKYPLSAKSNFAVEWTATGLERSHLVQETGYPDWGLSCYSSVILFDAV